MAAEGQRTTHRLSRDERREQLLDTAGAMVVDEGVESLTMEGIAAKAGVSKALPYKFFANREDLLLTLYDREVHEVGDRLEVVAGNVEPFEERLRVTIRAWLEHMQERGLLLGILMTTPLLTGPIQKRQFVVGEELAVEWGELAAEEFHIPPDRAVDAAAVLLAGTQGLLQRWIGHHDRQDELVDSFVTMTVAAFAALGEKPTA
jgi:AcrR family transcriptional regulator